MRFAHIMELCIYLDVYISVCDSARYLEIRLSGHSDNCKHARLFVPFVCT